MVALYLMYYNFGQAHQTLRVTPAMEAGTYAPEIGSLFTPCVAFLDIALALAIFKATAASPPRVV
jgi:hypothetical protein